jgi:hypothetical protein
MIDVLLSSVRTSRVRPSEFHAICNSFLRKPRGSDPQSSSLVMLHLILRLAPIATSGRNNDWSSHLRLMLLAYWLCPIALLCRNRSRSIRDSGNMLLLVRVALRVPSVERRDRRSTFSQYGTFTSISDYQVNKDLLDLPRGRGGPRALNLALRGTSEAQSTKAMIRDRRQRSAYSSSRCNFGSCCAWITICGCLVVIITVIVASFGIIMGTTVFVGVCRCCIGVLFIWSNVGGDSWGCSDTWLCSFFPSIKR